MKSIYLDNASTTKIDFPVLEKIIEIHKSYYANPSSLHRLGIEVEKQIKKARQTIADYLKINKEELIFTGSGTIANNIAIQGAVNKLRKYGNKIITSSIEHNSVLEIFKNLNKRGFETVYIPVNKNGIIDIEKLKSVIDKKTILVSVMAVNNEIGSIQPLEQISSLVNNFKNIYLHIDAVQAFGKIPINLDNIDLLTISGHKVHGPKGIGALYIDKNILINKILYGSNQEGGYYPGTENSPGIIGFGEAVKNIHSKEELEFINSLKIQLKNLITESIDDVIVLTPSDKISAPHILNIAFANIKGEILVHSLERDNIYVSTGAACHSKNDNLSHVIKALNVSKKYQEGSIRISFSKNNTKKEVTKTAALIKKHVSKIRKVMR
ncbi:MAG: cysteine desulfurase [Halanaerobiales bacterium]|nr:cysteine desulfurase [Halanaerobiales bacterium]